MSTAVDTASVSSRQTVVLITGYDATTGDRMQVQCVTDSDRLASDALLVDLNKLGPIAAKVCVPELIQSEGCVRRSMGGGFPRRQQ